jgi:methylthioribose-1-phosphate isomerase
LRVLDQTRLPRDERIIELAGAADTAEAIRRMAVRGAPNIGIAAAYGLAMEVTGEPGLGALERGAELLRGARPTAANLARAVDRVRRAALETGPVRMAAAARVEAEAIHAEENEASERISERGAELLAECGRVVTHCNTGALAAGGRGTALGVIAELADRRPLTVLATETRPVLQGSRLTAWELRRLGIEHELIADAAAAGLIARGEADAVIVGCDRVAANGDVANKVGTYPLALAAREAAIPFVVAGPTSSIDPGVASGADIPIEERGPDEVREAGGELLTLPDTPSRNPAFDVTPARLVTALVTECGVARPVGPETVAALLSR